MSDEILKPVKYLSWNSMKRAFYDQHAPFCQPVIFKGTKGDLTKCAACGNRNVHWYWGIKSEKTGEFFYVGSTCFSGLLYGEPLLQAKEALRLMKWEDDFDENSVLLDNWYGKRLLVRSPEKNSRRILHFEVIPVSEQWEVRADYLKMPEFDMYKQFKGLQYLDSLDQVKPLVKSFVLKEDWEEFELYKKQKREETKPRKNPKPKSEIITCEMVTETWFGAEVKYPKYLLNTGTT